MEKKTIYDWFDALMEKRLSEHEKSVLRAKLKTDTGFREEFAFLINAQQAAKNEHKAQLREFYNKREKNRRLRFWLFGVAASFLLLVVGYLSLRPATFKNNQGIYAHFTSKTIPDFTTRSATPSDIQDILDKAVTAFEKQDWEKAATNFETYLEMIPKEENKSRNLKASLYKAIALRNIPKREQEAVDLLLQINNSPNFADKSDWELALTYLKMNSLAACLDRLDKIIATGRHDHKENAMEMKQAIKNLK